VRTIVAILDVTHTARTVLLLTRGILKLTQNNELGSFPLLLGHTRGARTTLPLACGILAAIAQRKRKLFRDRRAMRYIRGALLRVCTAFARRTRVICALHGARVADARHRVCTERAAEPRRLALRLRRWS
jgi:hypothetical protein